jgi:uncharacterized membrane protein
MDRLTKQGFDFETTKITDGMKQGINFADTLKQLQAYENSELSPLEVAKLKEENAKLRELLKSAVNDMQLIADEIANCGCKVVGGYYSGKLVSYFSFGRCDVCSRECDPHDECIFAWHHVDEVKEVLGDEH